MRKCKPSLCSVATTTVLGFLCAFPGSVHSAQNALQGAVQSQEAARNAGGGAARDGIIPQWRLDAAAMPTRSLETLANADAQERKREERRKNKATSVLIPQDQECPTTRLTKLLVLEPQYVGWLGQAGLWRDKFSNIILGSWTQSFAAQNWETVRYVNLDYIDAFRAEEIIEEELLTKFEWKAGLGPQNYSAIVELERPFRQVAHLTKVWDFEEGLIQPKEIKKKEPPTYIALVDCQLVLQYVVVLQKATRYPGNIDVYNRKGILVAHALTDMDIARHQFIDTEGRLLATAEAPGLNQNISFANLPLDPARGDVLTYVMKFESSRYSGASQLLQPDYRWILASAVQMRAVIDGRAVAPPSLPDIMPTLYWVITFVFIVLMALLCFCTTSVHPSKLPELMALRLQAQAHRAQQRAQENLNLLKGDHHQAPPWWQDGKIA